MRSHLEDDVLLDVTLGAASVEAERHVAECSACARRVDEARDGLSLVAGADAPEPSPMFWDAFRGRVASAIETEARPRRLHGFLAPALAAAAMVAVVVFLPRGPGAPMATPFPLAASSARPAAEEVVDAAAEDLGCNDVAACVVNLTDEESSALADALGAELAQIGDL